MFRRLLLVAAVTLFLAAPWTMADTVTIVNDTAYAGAFATGSGGSSQGSDVIGEYADFDIEKLVFTEVDTTRFMVEIWFNYHHGDASLSPYNIPTPACTPGVGSCVQLSVGDLLFDVTTPSGTVYRWGIPLVDRGTLEAGRLYQVSDNGVRTSDQDMGPGASAYWIWRYGKATRLDASSVIDQADNFLAAPQTVRVYPTGNEVKTTLLFDPTGTSFVADGAAAGHLSVHFASAFCANDVLDGSVNVHAPEPDSYFLAAAGLLLLLGVARRFAHR